MTADELLRQAAGGLARRLDEASESQLRRLAAAMATAAVERAKLSHPVIAAALGHLEVSASPDPELHAQVQALAEILDSDYLDLKQAFAEREDAGKTHPQVLAAFSRARAASAVAAALATVARTAAATAAYEALASTDDATHLTAIAERVLAG